MPSKHVVGGSNPFVGANLIIYLFQIIFSKKRKTVSFLDYQQVIKENAQLLKIGKYKEVLHNITSELQAPYLP